MGALWVILYRKPNPTTIYDKNQYVRGVLTQEDDYDLLQENGQRLLLEQAVPDLAITQTTLATSLDIELDMVPVVDVSDTTNSPNGRTKHISVGNLAEAIGFVNVKNKGAVGDGVTDDTAAIQNAIDTGKQVLFPDNYTFLTQGLTLDTAKQVMIIRGIVKLKNSTNQSVFTVNANRVRFYFDGGEIDGNKANQTTTTDSLASGIWLSDGVDKVEVWDPYIHDCKRNGVAGYGNNDSCVVMFGEIADCDLMSIYPSQDQARPNKRWQISGVEISGFGQDGIGTVGIQHSVISANRIVHPSDGAAISGIALEAACHYTTVFGNTIEGTVSSVIGANGIQTNDSHHVVISGNTCKSLGCAINVASGGTGTYAISITDNVANDCGWGAGSAISFYPSSAGGNFDARSRITGNTLTDCPFGGIALLGSSHCDISHNNINGVNLQNSANKRFGSGITLFANSRYNTVTFNQIAEGTGGNLKIGIHEHVSSAGNGAFANTIKGNRITGADFDIICSGTAQGGSIYSKVIRESDTAVTAAPTSGHWERGDEVLNEQPSAAGVPGWVCTTSGTFSATSTTGSIDAASSSLTLASATGLYAGMAIRVAGAGVASADLDTFILALDGTSLVATVTNAASTTVVGAVVSTPAALNPVFKAMAVLAA